MEYRKTFNTTRGTILFLGSGSAGTIQGRVQFEGGYYSQIPTVNNSISVLLHLVGRKIQKRGNK